MTDPTKELNTAYIVKSKLHPHGVVLYAHGESINLCLENGTEWRDVFDSIDIKLNADGAWVWQGYIIFNGDSDFVRTVSLMQVVSPFGIYANQTL